MLGKLFEAMYLKVFVNIVVDRSQTTVYVELCNKDGVVESNEDVFDTTTLNERMLEFIKHYTDESPYNYISLLDTSDTQGAAPSCGKNDMLIFFDTASSKHKCINNKWSYYTSKVELNSLQHKYAEIGVDFIFSPYALLYNFLQDKVDSNLAMYVLIEDNYLSLAVFDNGNLLFAEHLDMDHTFEQDELMVDDVNVVEEDIDLGLDGGVDLEDVDVEDGMDALDDFGDIEDLDSIEEIDEFAEAKDIEEEFNDNLNDLDEPMVEGSGGFNEDYQRFSLIQSAINRFYKEDKYDSQFIETVYIADGVGVSPDLKRYLEEEMFLNVYVRHIDLAVELGELSKGEVL